MEKLREFYEGKNVLVTGGAGFIGSHLVERLVAVGARVTVFDNFSTGKLSNLLSVLNRISIICADITSTYSASRAVKDKDIVFHLAALVSVPQSHQFPDFCHAVNVVVS